LLFLDRAVVISQIAFLNASIALHISYSKAGRLLGTPIGCARFMAANGHTALDWF
jgi:hypothetical protein